MGLFDVFNEKSKTDNQFVYHPVNEAEAWIAIFWLACYSDGEMNELEDSMFSRSVAGHNVFFGVEIMDFVRKVGLLYSIDRFDIMLKGACSVISVEYKETVFAKSLNILLFGGVFSEAEQNFMARLKDCLGITDERASMIIEVLFILNKGSQKIA